MQDPAHDSLPLDDLFISVFLLIDDWYQTSAPPCVRARRHNPTPATGCTDAELITIALVGELVRAPSEHAWYRLVRQNDGTWFPRLPSRQRSNARCAALAPLVRHLRRTLVPETAVAILDSFPVPVCACARARRGRFPGGTSGKIARKRQTCFGFRVHLVITTAGEVVDCVLTDADVADVTVAPRLLQGRRGVALGDTGEVSHPLEQWAAAQELTFLAWRRRRMRAQLPPCLTHGVQRTRRLVETVISQLTEHLQANRVLARTVWTLQSRLIYKLTAHTVGNTLNRLLGRPITAIKSLAF